jgi:hypothetical protein
MKEKLSRERWMIIMLLLLMNIVTIAAHSVYLQRVPAWTIALEGCLLAVAVIFAVTEVRKKKRLRENLQDRARAGNL